MFNKRFFAIIVLHTLMLPTIAVAEVSIPGGSILSCFACNGRRCKIILGEASNEGTEEPP